ncbi:MAG: hypothetical protein GX856_06755 [Gammaproteobacteria bacterium]|nr:hypothetical protein [Gammaproteobacteria bacterium]
MNLAPAMTVPRSHERDTIKQIGGLWYSFGPRVDRGGSIEVPQPDERHEFYGVYLWVEPGQWFWVADFFSLADVLLFLEARSG